VTERMTVEIHRGQDGAIPDLRHEWDQCLTRCPPGQTLFSHDWHNAWMQTCGMRKPLNGESIVLVVRSDEGMPILILPLAVQSIYGVRCLTSVGPRQPFRSFLCAEGLESKACDAVVSELFAGAVDWDAIHIGPTLADQRCCAALFSSLESRGSVLLKASSGPTIVKDLSGPFEKWRSSKSRKRILSYERSFLRTPHTSIEHFESPELAWNGSTPDLETFTTKAGWEAERPMRPSVSWPFGNRQQPGRLVLPSGPQE